MIKRIAKPTRIRRFKVWDLEWVPGSYELRVCGVFHPEEGYKRYNSIREFMANELSPENNGYWYYAHFSGGADLQFLIEELADEPYFRATGSFSGSSCVICKVRSPKGLWTFVDSYWLLRSSLASIAKSMGLVKTGPTDSMTAFEKRSWYATVDIETLTEYNRNDCEVLWKAIHRAQMAILDMGGQMQMTLASTALHLFQRKYLAEDISTSGAVNDAAKLSYIASRVEVYQRRVITKGNYFDVNSSFPYAMTFPLPGELYANYSTLPDFAWSDGWPFLLHCDFEMPDCYLPPIPIRLKNRVFFPVGKWKGWLTGIDVDLLVREGGKILKVYGCKVFRPFYDFANYANDLFSRRAATTDPFERDFYKLLLNAVYGKMAEDSEKTTMLINPPAEVVSKLSREDMLFPGVFFRISNVPIPHRHVPISSYITAIGRRTIFDFMGLASEVHYCDTDGFSTIDDLPISEKLGGLKLEKSYAPLYNDRYEPHYDADIPLGVMVAPGAEFLVPKLYGWQPVGGGKPITKAKGFSLSKDKEEARQQFLHLIEGGEIKIERMMRIRENLRGGNLHPRDKMFSKGLRQIAFLQGDYDSKTLPKRFMYPDGKTRAWTVDELTK